MYIISLVACMNSCNLGYEVGSVGGASLLMQNQYGWTDTQTEWFVAIANIFAIVGGLGTPLVADGKNTLE